MSLTAIFHTTTAVTKVHTDCDSAVRSAEHLRRRTIFFNYRKYSGLRYAALRPVLKLLLHSPGRYDSETWILQYDPVLHHQSAYVYEYSGYGSDT